MYVNRNPEYFLTIAREGNISHAAEKLFLTQSSLSQHLQRLEREVGMPLVDRSTIPLRLTPAGKVYREYLETHAYLYQKMVADMNSSSGGETVTVGIGTWRGARLMPKILPESRLEKNLLLHDAADYYEASVLLPRHLAYIH